MSMSLVDLSDLSKALGHAADAVGKLGDSIAHLVTLGTKAWDAASARRMHNRLTDISARLGFLNSTSNTEMIASLNYYIVEWFDNTKDGTVIKEDNISERMETVWLSFLYSVSSTLSDVKLLLDDIKQERSDLVTHSSYQDLIAALGSRLSVLSNLSHLPAPMSLSEIKTLEIISKEYNVLRDNLHKTIYELNCYIKNSKKKKNDPEAH